MGMHVIQRKGKSSALVLTLPRKNAPAFTDIVCFGRRVRKDGTCSVCETMALAIHPDKRRQVRIEHKLKDERVVSEPLSRIARIGGLVQFPEDPNVYKWPGRKASAA